MPTIYVGSSGHCFYIFEAGLTAHELFARTFIVTFIYCPLEWDPNGYVRYMKTDTVCAAGLSLLLATGILPAAIRFSDVTSVSGIQYTGESYGASWGDFNSDGLPDLFVNHHRATPGLYLNRGNGTFEDRHSSVDIWQTFPHRDQHGGAWADFDNDGDQDLLISFGSKDPTQFLINTAGVLSDHINDFTIDPTPHWQGRMPMWFDFNGDGLLDFAMATSNGIFQLFQQAPGPSFVKKNAESGHHCSNNPYGQLADVNFDGQPEWICAAQASFPYRIYDYRTLPFTNVTSLIRRTANTVDSVFADFDGDLREDLLLVTDKVRVSGAARIATNRVHAHLISDASKELGFTFKTTGSVTFTIHWNARNYTNVHIGSGGTNPPQPAAGQPIKFTLSPAASTVVGIQPHTSSTASSIYIGYDRRTTTWTFINASGSSVSGSEGTWSYVYTYANSTAPVSGVVSFGLTAGDRPSSPVLLTNPTGTSYVNKTVAAHLNVPVSC